jgi:glucosamine--fructose-6-phosphate aminotransferase (isomerizing)
MPGAPNKPRVPDNMMLTEIRQQPEALERTLAHQWPRIARFRAVLDKRKPRLVVIVARGTSDNAAQFGRYLIEIMTGIPVSLAAPSVHSIYKARVDYKDALVVGISQSGESTDIEAVLAQARQSGALTVGITNEPKSTLASMAEHVFLVRAGREKSVAATKTYTGQLMSLYLLAYALGAKIRLEDLQAIPEIANSALELQPQVAALAERYREMRHAAVVARGLNYANAFEFALKMMETSYVVAERFSAADFLHGPIAIVDQNLPVFLFGPSGPVWASLRETLGKLRQLNAATIVITDRSNREAARYASALVRIPASVRELYTPIPYIIPAQLFAAALASAKGLNADQPRGLQKVTRNL